ncbi:MAG: hypothetical protein A2Y73_00780 [Chloroflexi bacterium RBG_13_56_8]|nr:MAG: hypothetical protein A2Y73_00780 [Chloroflexi bacterium RBG_13_56_8]
MEVLQEGAKSLGLSLSSKHLAAFEQYYRELSSWNQRFNLTTITGYEQIQNRHFLDSLSCVLALPFKDGEEKVPDVVPLQRLSQPLWCIDVGSGAGFPGLPLKIMLPEAKMTLVEATGKKVAFLKHIVRTLQLENVEVLHARAEDVGHMPEHRESYDLVMARAVANLGVLAEYCLPLCRVGGRMVAQKGEDALEEAPLAERAFQVLGGALKDIKPVTLPGLPEGRYLVVVTKVAKTPEDYPRRPGMPTKRPLC